MSANDASAAPFLAVRTTPSGLCICAISGESALLARRLIRLRSVAFMATFLDTTVAHFACASGSGPTDKEKNVPCARCVGRNDRISRPERRYFFGIGLDRELGASLATTTHEDFATGSRLQACAKTVRFGALSLLWLIRSFHIRDYSPKPQEIQQFRLHSPPLLFYFGKMSVLECSGRLGLRSSNFLAEKYATPKHSFCRNSSPHLIHRL